MPSAPRTAALMSLVMLVLSACAGGGDVTGQDGGQRAADDPPGEDTVAVDDDAGADVDVDVDSAGTDDADPVGADDDTLVIAVEGEPSNLNPIFGDVYGSFNGDHWPIFSSLLTYDDDIELQPDLAADPPEISEDGRTVTVTLRDDVTWHDGMPFSAADVVFTYTSILDPDVATGLRDQLFDSMSSVEAVDDATVRFTLSRLDPAFLDKLTVGIVPEHLLEGEDLNTARFNVDPVGTGPFVFEEFREGERLVVSANPDFFGGDVGLDRVVFAFVGDENVRVARLEAGDIDVDAVGLFPRIAERFDGDDRYEVVGIPGEMYTLRLPSENPVLSDPRVRHAIGLAVDREGLVQALFDGRGRPAFGPFQPQHWAYDPAIEYDHDPDAAVAALEDAGWQEGPDGVRERDGEPLAFTYVHGSSPLDTNAALFIADAMRGLGMDVELEVVEDFADRNERLTEGAVTSGRPGNAFDPELDVYNAFHSDNIEGLGTNRSRIDDAAVDDAIEDGRASVDRDERREAYSRLQVALQDHGGVQYLVQRDYQMIVSTDVQGLNPGAADNHLHGWARALLWNLHEWELS